jgi:hypothetical protein
MTVHWKADLDVFESIWFSVTCIQRGGGWGYRASGGERRCFSSTTG